MPDAPPDPSPDAVPPPSPAAPRVRRLRRSPRRAPARHARLGLQGATLAAAVTVGALVGFGLHDGASLARLGVVTLRLRGLPEFVSPDRGAIGAALLGGAHTARVSGVWGAAAALVHQGLTRRGVGPVGRAVALALFAGVLWLVDGALPTPLRLAAGAVSGAERVLVVVLLVAAGWWVVSRLGGGSPPGVVAA